MSESSTDASGCTPPLCDTETSGDTQHDQKTTPQAELSTENVEERADQSPAQTSDTERAKDQQNIISISEDVPDDDADDGSDAVPSNHISVVNSEGENDLLYAVRHNHCDRIRQLIRSGYDCNAVCKLEGTPCTVRVHRDNFHKQLQMMGYAPLHVAAIHSSLRTIKHLLSMGADVNIRDKNDRTPLQISVTVNRKLVAELFIQSGADVNTRSISGRCPLIEAVLNVNLDLTRMLLAAGANPNLTDIKGMSPLCAVISAMAGPTRVLPTGQAIVQSLIDAGCDIDHTNPAGASALMLAAGMKVSSVVSMLISAGADVNLADRAGCTSFSMAIEGQRNLAVIRTLMGCGAATHQPDNRGQTPLSKVLKYGSVTILRLLLSADAVPHTYDILTAPRIIQVRSFLPDFDSWLQEEFYQPRSLRRLCREVIRCHMSPHNLPKVESLGLPRTLNDFVLGGME